MTHEQIVLDGIRRLIAERPDKDHVELLAKTLRENIEIVGDVMRLAIALVGAEMAAQP